MIKIPLIPLSAVCFYLITIVLWNLDIIPSPKELLGILEVLFENYGYLGLVIATLLEGISYICLYFPGAFIIALTVFFSDSSFTSLLTISAIVSVVLTFDALINYLLGPYLAGKRSSVKNIREKRPANSPKGFVASMLHPNFLAFYFLNAGLKEDSPKQILYVPLFMFPYGMVVAYTLSIFSGPIRQGFESPTFILGILVSWFLVALLTENKKIYSRLFNFGKNPASGKSLHKSGESPK